MTTMTTEDFAVRFFDLFERSSFRLEQLQRYVASNETDALRSFLAGDPIEPQWDRPWARQVRLATGSGRTMSRVHMITEPLTDYVRYELTYGYPVNVEAGEDVRIVSSPTMVGLDLPDHDFWLFDSRLVALMVYDQDGEWLSVELTDDPTTAAQHCWWRDVFMGRSIPLSEYMHIPTRRTA